MRFAWRDLEPSPGQYDFSQIDRKLAQANSRGGKFGFRVISAASGQGALVPQYLMAQMPKGFWFDSTGGSHNDTYLPDWNSPAYLDRVTALLSALQAAYSNDPRLGWVDIGLYGNFGEWHLYGLPYDPSPTGATPITPGNAHRIIDAHVAAFPKQRLIVQTANEDALNYALNLSPRIGWRSDCLGEDGMAGLLQNTTVLSMVKDRWKTAPVLAEYCFAPTGSGLVQRAPGQVSALHIAMVSNGNLQPWETYTGAEQNAIAAAYTTAGYRFVLDHAKLPGSVQPGGSFAVTTSWSNAGSTPAYDPWQVVFQLRDHQTEAVTWEGTSQLDLQQLTPTGDPESAADTPQVVNDAFTLPDSIAAGSYDVALLIRDANGYYDPLALAIQGRQADGSYGLGTVTVQTGDQQSTASTPSPTE
jgi:hypothetical protein